jgi:hypothetical protein
VIFAEEVCEDGRLQLEKTMERHHPDGEKLRGIFWNFTGNHHRMYLCLPPVDVCEFLTLNNVAADGAVSLPLY